MLEVIPLNSSEIQHIASETAKAAVRETLLAMGIDVSKPEAVQEMQKDMAHVRESRLAVAAIKTRAYMVITGTLITGVIAAIWVALRGAGKA